MMGLLSVVAIGLYVVATFWCGLGLVQHPLVMQRFRQAGQWLGGSAMLAHMGTLWLLWQPLGGLTLGFFAAVSLASFCLVGLFLFSMGRKPVATLGVGVFPLGALGVALAIGFPQSPLLPKTASWGLGVHVLSSMLAYGLLSLAAVQAVVLALQERQLRHHQLSHWLRSLPPLQTMEAWLFQLIGWGFGVLSLALLVGLVYLQDIFAQHLVHKTVLSGCAWLVFGGLLMGRHFGGWRGRTAIRWTLAGFSLLLLSYFGSKAVLELILR